MEGLVAGSLADGASALRHQAHRRRGHPQAVRHHRRPHAEGRHDYQLRRCRPGGRAHPALGDAEGRCHLSRQAPVDIVTHRGSHPRGLRHAARSLRLPAPLRGRPLSCHRRLAAGHERHPTLHTQVRTKPPGALHRPRADTYARPHRPTFRGNHQLRPRAVLGAQDHLPRHHVQRHTRTPQVAGGGPTAHRGDTRPALHHHRRH